MANKWGNNGNSVRIYFWAPKSLQMVIAAMKLKDAYSLEAKEIICSAMVKPSWLFVATCSQGLDFIIFRTLTGSGFVLLTKASSTRIALVS